MIIGITGGIGAGKSIVAQILAKLGYDVYDCDSRAKKIIDNSPQIHSLLCQHIHPEAVVEGKVNRPCIAKVVFSDSEALKKLNEITHSAVKEDLKEWITAHAGEKTLFIETAIPTSSGLSQFFTQTWLVEAPEITRIQRVIRRNGLSAEAVKSRIESQSQEFKNLPDAITITNDGVAPLLPQIQGKL